MRHESRRYPPCCYDLALTDHYEPKLGMADAKSHPFKGILDVGPPPDPIRLRETQRVIAEVAEERRREGKPSSPRPRGNLSILLCAPTNQDFDPGR
jgi:hypothetical protein